MSFLRKVFGSKTQEEKYIGGVELSVLSLMKKKYKKNEEFTENFYSEEKYNLTRQLVGDNILVLLESGLDFNKVFDNGPIFLYCGDKETYEILEYFGVDKRINLKDNYNNYKYDIKWDNCEPFMITRVFWEEFIERLIASNYKVLRRLSDKETLKLIHFDKRINIAENGFYESFYQNYWNGLHGIFSKYYTEKSASEVKALYDFLVNEVKVDFHEEVILKFENEIISLPSWFVYIREFNQYSINGYELTKRQRGIIENLFNVSLNDKSEEGRNVYFSLLGLNAKHMSSAVKALMKLEINPNEKDIYGVSFLDILYKNAKEYAPIIKIIHKKLGIVKSITDKEVGDSKKKRVALDSELKRKFGKSASIVAEFLDRTKGPKSLVNHWSVKDDVEAAKLVTSSFLRMEEGDISLLIENVGIFRDFFDEDVALFYLQIYDKYNLYSEMLSIVKYFFLEKYPMTTLVIANAVQLNLSSIKDENTRSIAEAESELVSYRIFNVHKENEILDEDDRLKSLNVHQKYDFQGVRSTPQEVMYKLEDIQRLNNIPDSSRKFSCLFTLANDFGKMENTEHHKYYVRYMKDIVMKGFGLIVGGHVDIALWNKDDHQELREEARKISEFIQGKNVVSYDLNTNYFVYNTVQSDFIKRSLSGNVILALPEGSNVSNLQILSSTYDYHDNLARGGMVGDLSDDYSSIKIAGNLLVNNKQSKYSCHIGVPFEYQKIGTPKAKLEVVDALVAGPLTFIEISIDLKV